MNVIRNGAIIGEIVLTGTTSECAYEGEHGSLPYGFIRHGAATPEIVVCDTHCHTDDGYFAGVLSKIQHPAGLVVTSPAPVTIDNGLLPCPFCGGAAVIELAWRKTGRWIAYCEDNCVGDIHTHYFGAEDEARAAWNRRAPRTEELPLSMLLYCPACGTQHIDEPDELTPGWTNPPHRSHLCHACACIWRPADVPTNGVKRIGTLGKADTWEPGSMVRCVQSPRGTT